MTIGNFEVIISERFEEIEAEARVWVARSRSEYNAYPIDEPKEYLALVEIPEWVAEWRPYCGHKIKARFWVGKSAAMSQSSDPKEILFRDELQDVANRFLTAMAAHFNVHLLEVSTYQYFDAAEGVTLENYCWVMFDATMKVYDDEA